MDVIKNEAEARHRANISLSHHTGDVRNCIVTQHGSVLINCDIASATKQLKADKEKFFIVKNDDDNKEVKKELEEKTKA